MDTSNYGRCQMGNRGNGRPYPMHRPPMPPCPPCPPPCPPPRPKEAPCPCPPLVCDNGAASSDSSCSIASHKDPLRGMSLAMPYVPWQRMRETYEPDRAIQLGTLFVDLDLPFSPGRCCTCPKS